MKVESVKNIVLDYEKAQLEINGKKIINPVRVVVKKGDGWDIAKLFNHEMAKPGVPYPVIIIDVSNFFEEMLKQELMEIIREVVKEEESSQHDPDHAERKPVNGNTV